MIRCILTIVAVIAATAAQSDDTAPEKIVAGLSQNRVAITANFDGSEILIYGAVKRETPTPTDSTLDMIITVEGPSVPLVIRRKEKLAGIWINGASVRIDSAPSFYTVATSGPLATILSNTDDLRNKITIPQVIRAVGISAEASNSSDFVEALQRIRLQNDSYRIAENSVQLVEETLFRTDVVLPANLTEGNYRVRMFLLRGGKVVDTQERLIGVRKAGLERLLFNLAHERPFLYGVISLLMAAVAGWAASAAFAFMRR